MAAPASERGASTLWIMLLTLASTVTTLALHCATPFTALAALAATQMRARDGVALMLASWAASQVVGFAVHGYAPTAENAGWAGWKPPCRQRSTPVSLCATVRS